MGGLLMAVLVTLSASSLAYWFLDTLAGQGTVETRKIQTRLESLLQKSSGSGVMRNVTFSSIGSFNRMFKRQRMSQKLYQLLALSGWTMPISVFVSLDLLWAVSVFLVVTLVSHNGPLAMLIGAILGAFPYWLLIQNKKRYVEKITVLFPDALVMMKNALKAGQGLQAAFQLVGEEGPKPVCTEFSQLVHEIEVGSKLNEALNALYKRIHTTDLRIFVLGIFIQQEVGGNLVELFDHVELTIRERLSLSREIKALTAQGRLTGYILGLLPVAVALLLMLLNPGYLTPLFQPGIGRVILQVAVAVQCVGFFFIRKITTFSMLA